MMAFDEITIHRLRVGEKRIFDEMLSLFGRAFDEDDTYNKHRPRPSYIDSLLGTETFLALAALREGCVIGALAAYELKKFEQERSEIYVYDLAVDEACRRQGVATAMLRFVTEHAARIGAHAVFVQADRQDLPAIALYDSLGLREEVFHFDLRLPKPL